MVMHKLKDTERTFKVAIKDYEGDFNMNNESKEEIIDLSNAFKIIKKSSKTVFFWAIVGLVISLLTAIFFVTPKFSSTLEILVNQPVKDSNQQFEYATQQADLQKVSTYKDLLTKSIVLDSVNNKLQKKDNYVGGVSGLKNSLTVSNEEQSQVISVSVIDKNAYIASDAANLIGERFTKIVKKVMKANNVTIVSKARPAKKPVSPNKKIYALTGIIVGILVGIIIFTVKELLDTTVKDTDFITNDLELVNLGEIYHINNKSKKTQLVKISKKFSDSNQRTKRV